MNKSYKDALSDAISAVNPQAIATVMGPDNEDNQNVDYLAMGNELITDEERRSLSRKKNDLNSLIMQRIAEKVKNDTIIACQEIIDKNSAAQKELIDVAQKAVEDEVTGLHNQIAAKGGAASKTKMIEAKQKFDEDLDVLIKGQKAINAANVQIVKAEQGAEKVQEDFQEQDTTDIEVATKMEKQLAIFENQRKRAEAKLKRDSREITNHFQGTEGELSSDTKRDVTELKLPKRIDKEDGAKEFANSLKTYVKNRTESHGVVTVYMLRTMDDVDPSNGNRYKPPSIDDYSSVSDVLVHKLKKQNKELYEELKKHLESTKQGWILTKLLTKATLDLGSDAESITVAEGDGLSAIYAIVRLYFKQNADWQDLIKDRLTQNIPLFGNGSPLNVINEILPDLHTCNTAGIMLAWGTYGEKIVEMLKEDDDIAIAIAGWRVGGEKIKAMKDRQNSVNDIIDLLAVVETVCTHIESKEQIPEKRQEKWKKMANAIQINNPDIAARFQTEACDGKGRVVSKPTLNKPDGMCNAMDCNRSCGQNKNKKGYNRFCDGCWSAAIAKKAVILCKDGFQFKTEYKKELDKKRTFDGNQSKHRGNNQKKRKHETANLVLDKKQQKKLKQALSASERLIMSSSGSKQTPTEEALSGKKNEGQESQNALKKVQAAHQMFKNRPARR